ncbi:FKBP-type peptidyl-prolyl cis-trans isomerase [Adhaeribacter aquaticus]|uniref:FKBP-type peptidyl-prolyl cis-trans isomerase n=1 Tax=Adhaeribacter aquaticus TaxID=299567 RepID=UPI000411FAD1|nr:FKBP-type peptidyl-prolyl cis-trans isomerase [Adhaeribacter aquaticus]
MTEMAERRDALDEEIIKKHIIEKNITNAQRQASGLYYVPKTPGTGDLIQKGDSVRVHYIGKFLDGYKFESSYDNNQPLRTKVGVVGMIVKGMDEGLQLMRKDEVATLILPSNLGYGMYGNGGSIPGRTVIQFEVKVLSVKKN